MKTYIYILFILFTALLTVSCENELPFNIKDNPPKLVMNALINADSLTNTLYLNFTGKEHTTYVQNTTLEVRINGQLTESLRPLAPKQENTPQCSFNITSRFAPGDVIRVDAITDDGQYHAWAEVTVPQRPADIEKIDTLTVPIVRSGYYTQDYLQYKITFKDRLNENNFYRIILDKQMTARRYHPGNNSEYYETAHDHSFIVREDVVLTDGQPTTGDDEDNGIFEVAKNLYGVFDDSRFKNESYTMTIYNSWYMYFNNEYRENVRIDVTIRLLSINETEYYYLKALNLLDSDVYDETISEPIKYPSNVHGGVGIVGVSTEVSKTVCVQDYYEP